MVRKGAVATTALLRLEADSVVDFGKQFNGLMTWIGRNELILAAIIAHLQKFQYRIVSIGSGPIDWLIALHPKVEEMLLVDANSAVCGLLESLKRGEVVALDAIERLCRNAPNLPNTDLSDDTHLSMGIERLHRADVLPEGWSRNFIRTSGITMPEVVRSKVSVIAGDAYQKATEYFDHTWGKKRNAPNAARWSIVHLSNVIHEMEKSLDPWCMDDFFRMLYGALDRPGTLHIHTPASHFLRTKEGLEKRFHLCDQLTYNSLNPHLIVLVDAVISGQGAFRGNYSICCNSYPRVDLATWVKSVSTKYNIEVELRDLTLDGLHAWTHWQPEPKTFLPLALVHDSGDRWQEARITWKDLEYLLGYREKLTFGRNFHDGYRLFNPIAPI